MASVLFLESHQDADHHNHVANHEQYRTDMERQGKFRGIHEFFGAHEQIADSNDDRPEQDQEKVLSFERKTHVDS